MNDVAIIKPFLTVILPEPLKLELIPPRIRLAFSPVYDTETLMTVTGTVTPLIIVITK